MTRMTPLACLVLAFAGCAHTYPEEMSVTSPYIGQRVEGNSFVLDKPLPKGEYRLKIEAFNGSDQKLSEGPDDFKFTITDGPAS